MTTKAKAVHASKGLPVNHCSGFRPPSLAVLPDVDGIISLALLVFFFVVFYDCLYNNVDFHQYNHSLVVFSFMLKYMDPTFVFEGPYPWFVLAGISRESFSIDVNAKDYGFEPTDTPRTDRSVGACPPSLSLSLST